MEAPAAAKRRDLEARLATADVGRAVALDALKKGVPWLVALERGVREKTMGLPDEDVGRGGILRPPTWCCAEQGTGRGAVHYFGVC